MELENLLFNDKTPLSVLRHSTLTLLSNYLNVSGELNSGTKRLNNYVGLAELIGFSKEEIDRLKDSADPTVAVLDKWPTIWERTGSTACVGKLWCILRELGRDDVLREMEENVREDIRVEKDSLSYEEKEMSSINIDSVTGEPMFYDGFVAYDDEEEDRITEIVKFIEEKTGLRLFYYPRDMEPGLPIYPAQAYLIEKRCRKLICFVTKDFIKSPCCSFIVRYVHHLSPDAGNKKILPLILDKQSPLPNVLTPIVKVNFSSCEQIQDMSNQLSWNRLVKALSTPAHNKPFDSVGSRSRSSKSSTSVDKDRSRGRTSSEFVSEECGLIDQASPSLQNVSSIEIELRDMQTDRSRLMTRQDGHVIYRRCSCTDEDSGIDDTSQTSSLKTSDQCLQKFMQKRDNNRSKRSILLPCFGKTNKYPK